MTHAQIVAALEDLKAEIIAYGVESLRLFGSHARGTPSRNSDIDMIVTFRGPATFDAFMGLKNLLEDRLGRRVDLVTDRALRSDLRSTIEREAIRVA